MSLVIPRETLDKLSKIVEPDDFKKQIFEMIGPLDRIDVFFDRVFCVVYIGNEMTPGGIIKPRETIAEDIWQGKAALVIKAGPAAFNHPDWLGQKVEPGDWVMAKIGNVTQVEINKIPCRVIAARFIEGRIADPRMVTS